MSVRQAGVMQMFGKFLPRRKARRDKVEEESVEAQEVSQGEFSVPSSEASTVKGSGNSSRDKKQVLQHEMEMMGNRHQTDLPTQHIGMEKAREVINALRNGKSIDEFYLSDTDSKTRKEFDLSANNVRFEKSIENYLKEDTSGDLSKIAVKITPKQLRFKYRIYDTKNRTHIYKSAAEVTEQFAKKVRYVKMEDLMDHVEGGDLIISSLLEKEDMVDHIKKESPFAMSSSLFYEGVKSGRVLIKRDAGQSDASFADEFNFIEPKDFKKFVVEVPDDLPHMRKDHVTINTKYDLSQQIRKWNSKSSAETMIVRIPLKIPSDRELYLTDLNNQAIDKMKNAESIKASYGTVLALRKDEKERADRFRDNFVEERVDLDDAMQDEEDRADRFRGNFREESGIEL